MAKYEKWLGAGLGWMMTGNPLGGLLGFIAGSFLEKDTDPAEAGKNAGSRIPSGISEFETNLLVLASHLIRIDGKVAMEEITFTRNFLDTHFDKKYSEQRAQVLNHCLQKEYDLDVVCRQIR